jgi:hypothetical protein
MSTAYALLVAAVVVLTLLIAGAYVWYRYYGWAPFQFTSGDNPAWNAAGTADVSRLRFADAVFAVRLANGTTRTADVTAVLNGMAAAYEGGTSNPTVLTLTRPLNPFSFVIPGFNDAASVPDPTLPDWCSSPPAACTADAQCGGGVAGACSCSTPDGTCPAGVTGACYSCPGGALVALTGKWRTI